MLLLPNLLLLLATELLLLRPGSRVDLLLATLLNLLLTKSFGLLSCASPSFSVHISELLLPSTIGLLLQDPLLLHLLLAPTFGLLLYLLLLYLLLLYLLLLFRPLLLPPLLLRPNLLLLLLLLLATLLLLLRPDLLLLLLLLLSGLTLRFLLLSHLFTLSLALRVALLCSRGSSVVLCFLCLLLLLLLFFYLLIVSSLSSVALCTRINGEAEQQGTGHHRRDAPLLDVS